MKIKNSFFTLLMLAVFANASFASTITIDHARTFSVVADNTMTLDTNYGQQNPTLCIGDWINRIVFKTTGATGATFSGLPQGLYGYWDANSTIINGIPTESGTFNYTITLTGGQGTVSASGTIIVNQSLSLVYAMYSEGSLGLNLPVDNIKFHLSNSATDATFSGLPTGLTSSWDNVNKIATIAGTPTQLGSFNYTMTARALSCNGDPRSLVIQRNLTVVTAPAANTVGVASSTPTLGINTSLTAITHTTTGAIGIANPIGLPAGVTAVWANNIITISGTPTTSGTFNYSIPLHGGYGQLYATGTITVVNGSVSTVTPMLSQLGYGFDTQTVCAGQKIRNFSYQFTRATGATFSGLPAGVYGGFNTGTKIATIYGTPTVPAVYNYTVTSTGTTLSVSTSGTITVTNNLVATVSLTSSAASTTQNKAVNIPISNIVYTFTGANNATCTGLPAGVSVCFEWGTNKGIIFGTPTVAGTYNYTITSAGTCTPVSATGTITVLASALRVSSTNDSNLHSDDNVVSVDAQISNKSNNIDLAKVFKVVSYPSPFSDSFRLNLSTSSEEKVTIKVYNMTGQLVYEKDTTLSELERLELGSQFVSGLYNVVINQAENAKTFPVFKR